MDRDSYKIETLPKHSGSGSSVLPDVKPAPSPKPAKSQRAEPKACQCGKTELANSDVLTGIGQGLICGLCRDCGVYLIAGRRFIGGRQSLIRQRIPSITGRAKI